jgi:hypothetical protein
MYFPVSLYYQIGDDSCPMDLIPLMFEENVADFVQRQTKNFEEIPLSTPSNHIPRLYKRNFLFLLDLAITPLKLNYGVVRELIKEMEEKAKEENSRLNEAKKEATRILKDGKRLMDRYTPRMQEIVKNTKTAGSVGKIEDPRFKILFDEMMADQANEKSTQQEMASPSFASEKEDPTFQRRVDFLAEELVKTPSPKIMRPTGSDVSRSDGMRREFQPIEATSIERQKWLWDTLSKCFSFLETVQKSKQEYEERRRNALSPEVLVQNQKALIEGEKRKKKEEKKEKRVAQKKDKKEKEKEKAEKQEKKKQLEEQKKKRRKKRKRLNNCRLKMN